MSVWIHVLVNFEDFSIARDQHALPLEHANTRVRTDAISFGQVAIGVHEQVKGKVVLGFEFLMTFLVLLGDSKHDGTDRFEFFKLIAKVAGFFGASWGVVHGIEIKQNRFALERGEFDHFAILILQRKIRGLIAWSQTQENG